MGEDFLKNDIVKYPDNLVGKLCVLSCVFLNGEKIFFLKMKTCPIMNFR